MFNLLKWIYNLGVIHERRRIEAFLKIESINQSNKIDDMFLERREETKETRKNKIDRNLAIAEGINSIINGLYRPIYSKVDEYESSVMYPKEDK